LADERFAALLAALAKTFGLDELSADEDGACALMFDDQPVSLQLDSEGGRFTLFAQVGMLAPGVPPARLENLLAGNLFWAATEGPPSPFSRRRAA
jgi:hypothetical protein